VKRGASIAVPAVAGAMVSGVPSVTWWLASSGQDPLDATREIGRRLTGRPSLIAGALGHGALSLVFSLPARPLARRRCALGWGAGYGAALYTVNFRLLAPRVWPQVRRLDGPWQIADHVAFGVVTVMAVRRVTRPAG
jgi:hypothetical protein